MKQTESDSMQHVVIREGHYRLMGQKIDVSGREFPLVHGYRTDDNGGFVQVDASAHADLPARAIRLRVAGEDSIEVVGGAGPAVKDSGVVESDEEVIERLRVRFDMLEDMARAVKRGDIRAMIVSGPPGVGKSHGIERVLERYQLVETLGGERKYDVVKGAMSAIGLYVKLYKYSSKDSVIVFDDCDSIFADELSLNILKAALDSKKRRMIHWNTDSHKLRNEGVPDQFCFEGSAIFITNLKFDRARGKIREHLAALESRCHYMDLTIDTEREKLLRIRQIVSDGMLREYGFTPEIEAEIELFVNENRSRLRELSLRTVVKIADLVKAFPDRWRAVAENTVMR
jgi:hypothetical protein